MDSATKARLEVADRLTDEAFPNRVGVQSTHYDGCWKYHPECAFFHGVVRALEAGITPLVPMLRQTRHDSLVPPTLLETRIPARDPFANCRDRCKQVGYGSCTCG